MKVKDKALSESKNRINDLFVQSFPPYDNITPKHALKVELKAAEYWKDDLKSDIANALHYATSREHFIKLMYAQSYKVRWEDSRKSITFATPRGVKCRDRKLGEPEYYGKANFEIIFEQNARMGTNTDRLPKSFELMEVSAGAWRHRHLCGIIAPATKP